MHCFRQSPHRRGAWQSPKAIPGDESAKSLFFGDEREGVGGLIGKLDLTTETRRIGNFNPTLCRNPTPCAKNTGIPPLCAKNTGTHPLRKERAKGGRTRSFTAREPTSGPRRRSHRWQG